jgi:aromatic-L-amino-acid decarboxylase
MDEAFRRLEPDRATQEEWLQALARFALDHVDGLGEAPAVGAIGPEGDELAETLSLPIPEEPLDGGIERAIGLLEEAVPASLMTTGPGYLAYIPGGGLPTAALADLVADYVNRFTGISGAAPALVRLEADVIAWLAREFGYGEESRGILTTGGSLANFSAIVAARHAALDKEADLRRAVAYTSAQVHHSVPKAFRLAGFPEANLRKVRVDAHYRMDPAHLAAAIKADREDGFRPFLVVASSGTVNTGAVDPLPEIADVCAEEWLWLHIDGAYGGAFALCDEGRRILTGIERSDSITFDPHKGLFLPYGTGCLLVREGDQLRGAHSLGADYLQDLSSGGSPSPADYGPELSRDYRGLRLWLPLMLHGAGAFREALTEKLWLARYFYEGLQRLQAAGVPIEIVSSPQLSIVPFRLGRRENESLESWNARNADFLAQINDRKRVYLSSTNLPTEDGDAFTLRVCVLSFRTHVEHIDACLEDVEASASKTKKRRFGKRAGRVASR